MLNYQTLIANNRKVTILYRPLNVNGESLVADREFFFLEYIHGQGMIPADLERQLLGVELGFKGTFYVEPIEPEFDTVFKIPYDSLLQKIGKVPDLGKTLVFKASSGVHFGAKVKQYASDGLVAELIIPAALRKPLQFEIEVVEVRGLNDEPLYQDSIPEVEQALALGMEIDPHNFYFMSYDAKLRAVEEFYEQRRLEAFYQDLDNFTLGKEVQGEVKLPKENSLRYYFKD